ncbi:MAG: hypothetical protein Q7U03_09360 [Syntrophales bacterium]|nr:hypothetical protein [Syntrophales bacterium]
MKNKWIRQITDRFRRDIWKRLNNDPHLLREMDLLQLSNWIGLKTPGTGDHILGMNELKRRQESKTRRIAYIALVISIASLALSTIKVVMSYLCRK